MDTTPGGVFLSADGQPQDADGNALKTLPDYLREEEKVTCRSAGLVARKQIDHYGVDDLVEQFGFTELFARLAVGDVPREEYDAKASPDAEESPPSGSTSPPSGDETDSDSEAGERDPLPDALSSRAVSALEGAGLTSPADLEGMTKSALLTINGIGEKTAEGILDVMAED